MKPLFVPMLLITGTLLTGCATTGSYTGNNRSGDLYYSLDDVKSSRSTYIEEVKGEDFAELNTQGVENYPGTKPPATQNDNAENRNKDEYLSNPSPPNPEQPGGETFNTTGYNDQYYEQNNYGNDYNRDYNSDYYDPYYSNRLNTMGRPRMSMSYYDPYSGYGFGGGPQIGFSVGYSYGYSGVSYSTYNNPYGYGGYDPFYDSFSCFRGPYWRNPYYYYYSPYYAYYSPYYGGYNGGYGGGYYGGHNHHNYYDYGYKKQTKRNDKNTQYGPRDTKAPSKSGYEKPYQYQKNDGPTQPPKPNTPKTYEQERDSRRDKIDRARDNNTPTQPSVEPRRTPRENERTAPRRKSDPRASIAPNSNSEYKLGRSVNYTPTRVKNSPSNKKNYTNKSNNTSKASYSGPRTTKPTSYSTSSSSKSTERKSSPKPRKRKR